jgi:hypothetical protein
MRCAVCEDYDLCSTCHTQLAERQNPLIKYCPGVAPIYITQSPIRHKLSNGKWEYHKFCQIFTPEQLNCNICKCSEFRKLDFLEKIFVKILVRNSLVVSESNIASRVQKGPTMYTCRDGCANYDICRFCVRHNEDNERHLRTHRLMVSSYKKDDWQYFQQIQNESQRLKEENAELTRALTASTSKDDKTDPVGELKYECNICCNEKISRALSCGHAFCKTCTNKFLEEKCPNCDQIPQGFQKIYFT